MFIRFSYPKAEQCPYCQADRTLNKYGEYNDEHLDWCPNRDDDNE